MVYPINFTGFLATSFAQILAKHAIFGTEQVFQHVFMALTAGTQQVGTPDKQVAWEVAWLIRCLAGHTQATVFQTAGDVFDTAETGFLGLFRKLKWIFFQLRCRWQPAHALGANITIDQALAFPCRTICQW